MAYSFLKYSFAFLTLTMMSIGFSNFASASSCCGQSPASFTVLNQAQKVSLVTSTTLTESLGRVYSDTEKFYVWPDDKKRTVTGVNLVAASVIETRHQVFTQITYQRGEYQDGGDKASRSHFGDTLLGYSYEVLPEFTYSRWKPVVHVSALVNLPTGHSIFDENELSEGADVTGHNQWGAGVGVTARKVWFPVTLMTQAKTVRLFDKNFDRAQVGAFYDSSLSGFATYATRWDVTLTAGLTWSHLSEKPIKNLNISAEPSEVTTSLIAAQWTATDSISLGASVSDQSLIGKPKNTILNRSYSLNFNYNYF